MLMQKLRLLKKEADGKAKATEKAAEATKKRLIAEGEGEASKTKATKEADADGEKAMLLARAEGNAAETRLKMVGEAEGTEKMAAALAKMDAAARTIIIMDRLPVLLKVFGTAGAEIMEAIFKNAAAPLGNIDNISIVDMGGNNGKGGINKISSLVPDLIVQVGGTLKAMGIHPTELIKQFKLDPSKFLNIFMGKRGKAPMHRLLLQILHQLK